MMKTLMFCLLAVVASGQGQPAEQFVANGRLKLSGGDLAGADSYFTAAVASNSAHAEANFLRAVSRLSVLPNQAPASAFLTRLGLPAQGRNLYDWTAEPPRDANGVLIGPAGVSSEEAVKFLRSELLPALKASEANLARIQDPDFLIFFTKRETRLNDLFVDYGDLLLLRAALKFSECFIYTLHSLNLDTQLATLYAMRTSHLLSAEAILKKYPNLLTFSSTDDRLQARAAFAAAIDLYKQASDLTRARPGNLVRLFNFDPEMVSKEMGFRQLLEDLKRALDGPVVIAEAGGHTFDLSNFFVTPATKRFGDLVATDHITSPRSWLPAFLHNGPLLGTLPDPTFGGLVDLTPEEADELLGQRSKTYSSVSGLEPSDPNTIRMRASTLAGHTYSLEFSSNLVDWVEVGTFRSTNSVQVLSNPLPPLTQSGFFRLADLTQQYFSLSGTVRSSCSGDPIPHALIKHANDGSQTLSDEQGRFFLQSRTSGNALIHLDISAPGFLPGVESFRSVGEPEEADLFLAPAAVSAPANDNFAQAQILSGVPVNLSGSLCGATREPNEASGQSSVWWRWIAPVTGPVSFHSDYYRPVVVYTGSNLVGLSRVGFSSFDAVAGTTYQIAVLGNSGSYSMDLGAVPSLEILQPANENVLPNDLITFEFQVADLDGSVQRIEIKANDQLIGVLTNAPWRFDWSNVPPDDYYIDVYAYDDQGNGAWAYKLFEVVPSNDDFVNRKIIASSHDVIQSSSELATLEPDEPDHALGTVNASVWFEWTPTNSGPISMTLFPQDDPESAVLAVYEGSSLENLTLVSHNTVDGKVSSALVSFSAVAHHSYQVMVGDQLYGQPFFLRLIASAAPEAAILSPAQGASFMAGSDVTLQATASDADGQVSRVDYYLSTDEHIPFGKPVIGSSFQLPFEVVLTNVPAGSYWLWAEATDNAGLSRFSAPRTFVVSVDQVHFQP